MKFSFNKHIILLVVLFISFQRIWGQTTADFPTSPNPPKLVNDFGGFMNPQEIKNLETLLDSFNRATSTQISIVTVKSLGEYDVSQYTVELGKRWGIGQKGRDNGILLLASMKERKVNISTGYGLEGVLPDGLLGRIIRTEITPFFKSGNYYQGFYGGVEALMKASKNEYTALPEDDQSESGGSSFGLIILVIIIVIVIAVISKGGGNNGRGGKYISRRGSGDFLTGAILGNILGNLGRGGSSGGGGSDWGGGSSGDGGFGGFGGGDFGGGGASGSW